MKASTKRLSLILVSVLLVATMLGACNNTTPTPTGGASQTAAPTQAASTPQSTQAASTGDQPAEPSDPDAPDPNVRYQVSWTGYQVAPLGNDPYILRHFEDILNVDFDIWNIDHQQYDELLNVRLASGEIPDMFMVLRPNNLQKYVAQDLLAMIPYENIEKYMPNTLAESWEEIFPGALDLAKIDGEIYGLPSLSSGNVYRLPIVYNQNWLDALGKSVPTTIEEFEDVIYAFAHGDPDGNGVKDTYGLSSEGLLLLWGMYGMVPLQDYFSEKDGELVFLPIEPELKEALAYAKKWYEDGVLDPEFITGENTGGYWAISHSYLNHRIGMTVIGNYYHWQYPGDFSDYVDGQEVPCEAGAVTKELLALHPDDTIAFGMPLINTDGKQGGIRGYNMLSRFYGVGINALDTPGKMNKILSIYEYTGNAQPDDETYITIRHGFENETWKWAERDRRSIISLSPFLEDDSLRYQAGCILWWNSGGRDVSRRGEWAAANDFDLGGIYSAFPTSTDSMSRYNSQLETMREQAYIQIITGEKPLDYFDTFVQEYLSQGGQEILNEINAMR
ncbi:MAG: extracellular solute-binding protein [Christensenellales bacterium]|jgi:putative aldouronate transport system substrate-binding protein